jgi:thiol-disulfide isomerase/thioredoxin
MVGMSSKRGIVTNALLFVGLIFGYFIVMGLSSQKPSRYISFESDSLNVPLLALGMSKSGPVFFKQFRGSNLVIHFWASWCEACESDYEKFNVLAREFAGVPLKIVGIVTSESREAIEKSGKLQGLLFPQFLDESGALAQAMNFKTLPQTLLVRADGEIVIHINRSLGDDGFAELKTQISKVLSTERQALSSR